MPFSLSLSLRDLWRHRGRSRPGKFGHGNNRQPGNLYLRARALLRSGDRTMAANLLREAAELDPKFTDAIEAQGEILDGAGETAAAADQYALARNLRRQMATGAPDRHFVLRQVGPMVAEIVAYSSVIKALRKHSLPYLARGNAYLASGEPQLALADYESALKLQPRSLDALALKAEALLVLGRFPEAAAAFDKVLAGKKPDVDTLGGHAIAEMANGRLDKANAAWRRQFELSGAKSSARLFIAMRMADYPAVLAAFEQLPSHEQNDPITALYADIAAVRLGRSLPPLLQSVTDWPGALRQLLRGEANAADLSRRAGGQPCSGELLFVLGILAAPEDSASAKSYWHKVGSQSSPWSVEHATALNELARLPA
jgi:tetratricopeptide (TPR) repeat protein